MPLSNYGELKTEVARWLNREDTETVERIPDFIRMAEADIYLDLRCQYNEFTLVLTPASADGALRLLPSNYKAMKLLTVNGNPLDPISPHQWAKAIAAGETGEPWAYCRKGQTLRLLPDLESNPIDWAAGTEVELVYYGTESLDALPTWQTPLNPVEPVGDEVNLATTLPEHDDTNTTRMFLQYPQMYLAGALYYANAFLDGEDEAKWKSRFDGMLAALEAESAEDELTGGENLAGMPYGEN